MNKYRVDLYKGSAYQESYRFNSFKDVIKFVDTEESKGNTSLIHKLLGLFDTVRVHKDGSEVKSIDI